MTSQLDCDEANRSLLKLAIVTSNVRDVSEIFKKIFVHDEFLGCGYLTIANQEVFKLIIKSKKEKDAFFQSVSEKLKAKMDLQQAALASCGDYSPDYCHNLCCKFANDSLISLNRRLPFFVNKFLCHSIESGIHANISKLHKCDLITIPTDAASLAYQELAVRKAADNLLLLMSADINEGIESSAEMFNYFATLHNFKLLAEDLI